MSSTMVDSWAVDLANIGPIYPWVGTEGIMFIVAVVLWILWHVWQIRFESGTYQEEKEKYATPENLKKMVSDETYLHH
ncbi:MAG TPA: hypothetical protein VGA50_10915 [Kiloniellales bacterium]